LTTVFARGASRDLFDIHNIVNSLENFDLNKVRLAFLVFGAMNRIDFTNINIDYIKINTIEMKNRLIPLIGKSIINKSKNFALNIEESVKKATKIVLPYKENEIEFLSNVNKHGIIRPELITNDTKLQQNIISQPHLVWKCKNVKEYRKNRNGS
jgi:hypothetical protein